MKLRNSILVLICTGAITHANGAERFQKMREGQQQAPQLEAAKKAAEAETAKLKSKTDKAMTKLAGRAGASPKATLTKISGDLGHDPVGTADDDVLQKVDDAKIRLGGAAGPDIHSAITNLNTTLGAGHPIGGGAAPADTLKKAENLLDRLKNIPAGHPIVAAAGATSIEAWLTAQGR